MNRHFPYGLSRKPIQARDSHDCNNAPPAASRTSCTKRGAASWPKPGIAAENET
jgi:hypothetical protein